MPHHSACPRCGFVHNCICHAEPKLRCDSHFVLLTHPKEIGKDTNTGQLMERSIAHCKRQIWDRVNPPPALLKQLADPRFQAWLLFPGDETTPATAYRASANASAETTEEATPLVIILDATWQEARKMVRRSPWLAALPRLELHAQRASAYALRRNQQPGNLCTCEAGIAVLETLGHTAESAQLQHYFDAFMAVFKAEKSGHAISLK